MTQIHGLRPEIIKDFTNTETNGSCLITFTGTQAHYYGLGERFDGVSRNDSTTRIEVVQQFTNQGADSYCPIPFLLSDAGYGLFIDSDTLSTFSIHADQVRITVAETDCELYFFYGTPKEILSQFGSMTGKPALPPKWAFGPWVSANRWDRQSRIEDHLREAYKYQYPETALVIEAWSDEATFYIWNDAQYLPASGEHNFTETDFHFCGRWPDPKGMIDRLHNDGIRLVLWQIPALKQLAENEQCQQHDNDCEYALEKQLVAKNSDGSAYQIPKIWFEGSYLPDFTNKHTRDWWQAKRRYLLEMGVDGFKTDGGEFIFSDDVYFSSGEDGSSMRNRYPADYLHTYREMVGKDRVLFSRAGYTGSQKDSIHWAGDQLSTFSELQAQLSAGLSLGLSGQPFWSFDIGGFAGAVPSAELYLRATALAVAAPIMQWHSEPEGGQYGGTDDQALNERSPWNIAKLTNDERVLSNAVYFANLRMNLLPEIYNQAQRSAEDNSPMMRHLVFDQPADKQAAECEDEFMLGDLLVAPVVKEGALGREVYLPAGKWFDFWSGKAYAGGQIITISAGWDKLPLFLRDGGAVTLNLPVDLQLGGSVSNVLNHYNSPVTLYTKACQNYAFTDDLGHAFTLRDGIISGQPPQGLRLVDIEEAVSVLKLSIC